MLSFQISVETMALSVRAHRILLGAVVAGCLGQSAEVLPQGFTSATATATEVIQRTSGLWTPLGYGTKRAQYSIGWSAAPVYGYVLLSAPTVAATIAVAGPVGATVDVGKDALLELARLAFEDPRLLARRIAAATRDDAKRDYAAAYAIVRRSRSSRLNDREALEFLDRRWGVLRLEAAGVLHAATMSDESSLARVKDGAAEKAVEALVDQYQLRIMGLSRSLPVAEAGLFIKELRTILERRGLGVYAFPPFVAFLARLEDIEQQRAKERQSFSPSATSAERTVARSAVTRAQLTATHRAPSGGATRLFFDEEWRIGIGAAARRLLVVVQDVPCECDSGEPPVYAHVVLAEPVPSGDFVVLHERRLAREEGVAFASLDAVGVGPDTVLLLRTYRRKGSADWSLQEELLTLTDRATVRSLPRTHPFWRRVQR